MAVSIDENGTINSEHWQLGNGNLIWYGKHHAGKLTNEELAELHELLTFWKSTMEVNNG